MEKIDNWNSLKLKTSILQQTPKKNKSQSTGWEKNTCK